MYNLGNKEILAENLAYYVSKSGRDQREIADAVGVAPSTFNEWMKAPGEPKLTEGEKMMLELFRKIPEDRQPEALELLRVALKMQKIL